MPSSPRVKVGYEMPTITAMMATVTRISIKVRPASAVNADPWAVDRMTCRRVADLHFAVLRIAEARLVRVMPSTEAHRSHPLNQIDAAEGQKDGMPVPPAAANAPPTEITSQGSQRRLAVLRIFRPTGTRVRRGRQASMSALLLPTKDVGVGTHAQHWWIRPVVWSLVVSLLCTLIATYATAAPPRDLTARYFE